MQLLKIDLRSTPILLLIGFCALFLRAWPRLLYPEIWIEDGTLNVAGFINEGLVSIASPVGGYLTLIPKLISLSALSISFTQYPILSIVFAWVITLLIFLIIAKAPTYLHGQFLLAVSCFFIPSDPEVFGLPSYTFWWSSLLLFILAFWKENQNTLSRALLLILSSLSAPICLITLPLFWARGILFKKPSEWLVAILASALAAIQLAVMVVHNNPGHLNISKTFSLFIPVFFGSYLVGNLFSQWSFIAGAVLLGLVVIGAYQNRSWIMASLLYLLVASILISAYRVELSVLNPIHAGPRYFFYPYILISWILIQFLFSSKLLLQLMAGILLMISCINAIPHLIRMHDRLNWSANAMNCVNYQSFTFPIHFAGDKNNTWKLTLKGEQCAELLKKDLLIKLN